MRLVDSFVITSMGSASGDALIKGRPGVQSRAEHVFAGPDGTYDLTLRFVDENDGAAQSSILRNGVTLDTWLLNKNLGSAIVTAGGYDQRVIRDVALRSGDVLAVVGQGDGGEPLWIDYLRITAVADWV
jgi:hypothetical protein